MIFLWTLLIGLLVGLLAKLIMPGRDPGGALVTMLLGVAGAFVARLLGQGVGWYREDEPVGFLASVLGAVILLFLYRILARRRHRTV